MPYFFIMKKVIFTILSILLSFVATSQDIEFEVVNTDGYIPKIHRVKPENVDLKIYRRYSNETEFQYIATKSFSSANDSYVDESITICHDRYLDTLDNNTLYNTYYYITNIDGTVISKVKGGNFGDSNSPEWPKLTYMDIDNNNLVIHWEPSNSDDIFYYELRKHNPINSSLQDGWDTIQPRQLYYRYIETITIAENICDRISEYTFPYTIFATDSCDNDSKTGDLDTTNNILYPPILKSVKYDNCNTLEFKWSKNRSLRGEIKGCQIQYKLFDTDSIKDIDILLSEIETTESDYQIYRLKVSEHPELSNNDSLYFRIKTTAKTTDEQYFSNKTCWFGPVTIGIIPNAPKLFSIVYVTTNSNNSKNAIKLIIEDKSPNHFLCREYILTRDYGDKTFEEIISFNDEIFNRSDKFDTIIRDENISNINSYIKYRLSVIYKCDNNDTLLLGETCFNSIYIENIGNDTKFKLSWNSISAGSYDNITYNVVRIYNGEEYSEDVQNETTYTDDLSFIEPNSFKPVKWRVEAIYNGNTIAVSNTIKLDNSGELQMPNAFIPDSDIPINRFFGPMNNFDENDIKKYRLLIFNNTGTLIWSTEEYSSDMETSRWNGNDFRGQPCVRGTYIYEVYVELDNSDKPLTARGTVTLIRNN